MSWHNLLATIFLVGMMGVVAAQEALFEDSFNAYPPGSAAEANWLVASGEWAVRDGRLHSASHSRAILTATASPVLEAQTLEVTLTVHRRVSAAGWAHAGLMLYGDGANFWRLGLVEDPDRTTHRLELLENYRGRWQAQSEPDTHLPSRSGGKGTWAYGQPYRLRLRLTPQLLRGEVCAAGTNEVVWWTEYDLPKDIPALRRGRLALQTEGLEVTFDEARVMGEQAQPVQRPPGPPRVAVLQDDLPGLSRDRAEFIAATLRPTGFDVTFLNAEQLADPTRFSTGRFDLLVLPECRVFPLPAKPNLLTYLESGGSLLALGGPPFQQFLIPSPPDAPTLPRSHAPTPADGKWWSVPEALARLKPAHFLVEDFAAEDLTQWQRSTNDFSIRATTAVEAPGPADLPNALRVDLADFTNWDTLALPAFTASPFAPGETLTMFWAKGTKDTQRLAVEWRERDGSRWIASVGLTPEWKHYVLLPADFRFWPDRSPPERANDHFRPENAHSIAFGPATSHGQTEKGPYTYWLAGVGVGPSPLGELDETVPVLEGLCPWYKYYERDNLAQAAARPDQAIVPPDLRWETVGKLFSPIWRPRGLGYVLEHEGRWIPLVEAYDEDGKPRAVAASLYLSLAEPFPQAAWGWIGISPPLAPPLEGGDGQRADLAPPLEGGDGGVQNREALAKMLTGLAHTLTRRLDLIDAGAEHFAYYPGEIPRLGARVGNFGAEPAEVTVSFALRPAGETDPVQTWTRALTLRPATMKGVAVDEELPALAPGRYEAVVELQQQGTTIDRIVHEFSILAEEALDPAEVVTVEDGQFRLNGKPWYAHGVNYWPLSVSGLEPGRYWGHWLRPMNYDPVVIERDLQRLRELGMNLVSIQYTAPEMARPLADFLSRCRRHGIKANVFLAGAHPLAFDPDLVTRLLTAARLPQSNAVFAYDLAWEPHLGDEQARRSLDPPWEKWIQDRYGSLENAEQDWGCAVPRTAEGEVTGPSDEQILNDGGWRVMVAAYRRFVDDLLSAGYGRVRRHIRRLDPHHLLGVRTGYGGTGQPWPDRVMAYDLLSGAKHLDFTSPEGYGMPAEWEEARATGFVTLYGRWAGNGKPVYWAEYGASIYPDTTPEKVEHQRQIWASTYRMILDSGANGSAGWWWPGGYRVNENSDFGIINPDGTPRPAALEAQRFAPQLTRPPDHRPQTTDHQAIQPSNHPTTQPPTTDSPTHQLTHSPPDLWLSIDRDLHPRGFSQVWARHRAEYLRAREVGQMVALRTAGTGTTSADCPLVAVGNRPYNGYNPPKYLNGEFNGLWIEDAAGEWVEVEDEATVEVTAGQPVRVRASLGNTGEAAWLPPQAAGEAGGVYLTNAPESDLPVRVPLPHRVGRYEDVDLEPFILTAGLQAPATVVFWLEAENRARFGEKRRVRLRPGLVH